MTSKTANLIGKLLIAGAACLSAPTLTLAQQDYPSKPITAIVPFNPGGTTDTLMRLISPGLSEELGQSVVVENRAGANSIIGTNAATRAPADGHTFVMGTSAMTLNHVFSENGMGQKLPYDSRKDLEGAAMLGITPYLLVVHAESDIHSVKDLVELAKSPEGVAYGSAGAGGSPHLAGILLERATGTEMLHVPFKGSGPAMLAVLGKQTHFTYATYTAAKPQVDGGLLRIIAVAAPQRVPFLPDVPTLAEQGIENADVDSWFGLLVPAGTPADVRERIAQAVDTVLSRPDTAKQLADMGAERPRMTAAEFDAFYRKDLDHWEKVLADYEGIIE